MTAIGSCTSMRQKKWLGRFNPLLGFIRVINNQGGFILPFKEVYVVKVNTIEQYKVLEFIKANFYVEAITVEIVDKFTLKVTDKNNETALFRLNDDGEVAIV